MDGNKSKSPLELAFERRNTAAHIYDTLVTKTRKELCMCDTPALYRRYRLTIGILHVSIHEFDNPQLLNTDCV